MSSKAVGLQVHVAAGKRHTRLSVLENLAAGIYNSDQGRYMFPTLLPIMTFIAIGLSALFPQRYGQMTHNLMTD